MEELLKYQEVDTELQKVQRELKNCEARDTMNKMSVYVKDAQNKAQELEQNSQKYVQDYNSLKAKFEASYKNIQDMVKNDVSDMSVEEVQASLTKVNTLSNELYNMEKNLNAINESIRKTLKDFEVTKNNIVKAKTKYKEAKAKMDEYALKLEPKITELEAKLAQIEKGIDKDLFLRYKTIKHNNTFPVMVKLNGKLCGACRMELPSKEIDKLKTIKYIVCEQCGRLIIND